MDVDERVFVDVKVVGVLGPGGSLSLADIYLLQYICAPTTLRVSSIICNNRKRRGQDRRFWKWVEQTWVSSDVGAVLCDVGAHENALTHIHSRLHREIDRLTHTHKHTDACCLTYASLIFYPNMLIEDLEHGGTVCKLNTIEETGLRSDSCTDLCASKLIADEYKTSLEICTDVYPRVFGEMNSMFDEEREKITASVSIKEGQRNALCVPANSQHLAIRLFVGAGARLLFYPTLIYNVVRNKFEPDFRWWDQIEPFLLLGAVPFPKDVYRLKSLGVEAVITLNESYETLVSSSLYESQGIKHLVIPTRDYLFAPSFDDIQRAVDFIHENAEQGKVTYVHCKAGRGRSTTIVLCYLVKYRGMTPFNAFNYVRSKRPRVLLAASQWKAVLRYSEYQNLGKKMDFAPFYPIPQQWPLYRGLHFDGGGKLATQIPHDMGWCGELPVLVTLSDLEGYEEKQEDSCRRDELQGDLSLAYKMGILTAKSVIGVVKASATLARLSYIWLGYQTENQAFNMTLTCSALSDGRSQSTQPMVSLHVCQQGLVEC